MKKPTKSEVRGFKRGIRWAIAYFMYKDYNNKAEKDIKHAIKRFSEGF